VPELSPRSVHVTDQILAVLASEYPLPVSTREIEERTGYGSSYGQLTYRMLTRLARRGEAEKITVADMKSRYWRLAAAPRTAPEPYAGTQAAAGPEAPGPATSATRQVPDPAAAWWLHMPKIHSQGCMQPGPRAPRPDLGNLASLPSGMPEVSLVFWGGVTRSPDLSAATISVERAEDLPALLAAAWCAFDYALQALRGAEDNAGPLLPAFVLAAAAAADGRDAVAAATSFAVPGSTPMETMASSAAAEVADQVARLSLALFTRLRDAAAAGGGSACADAAARAGRMHELLAPAG
jgi:hypothetical protein